MTRTLNAGRLSDRASELASFNIPQELLGKPNLQLVTMRQAKEIILKCFCYGHSKVVTARVKRGIILQVMYHCYNLVHHVAEFFRPAPINSRLKVLVRSRTSSGRIEMGCAPTTVPGTPGSPHTKHRFALLPSERSQKHSLALVVSLFFFCSPDSF